MVIEFSQQQLNDFSDSREEDLALWNWYRLKEKFPSMSQQYFDDNEKKGADFLLIAQTRVKSIYMGLKAIKITICGVLCMGRFVLY